MEGNHKALRLFSRSSLRTEHPITALEEREVRISNGEIQERDMQVLFTKQEPPQWLLDMWKEIDDKTFGKGFDCFTEDAVCNLGVADWKGREAIRNNLKAFIDTGFTARHHVAEYWDAGFLKVFHGVVDMTPDDRSGAIVHPTMCHFFYMDEKDNTKVRRWVGAVGPVSFG
jgi:hypothetical protein